MMYSMLSQKKILCFGLGSGTRRQLFLHELGNNGVDLTVLRFPGEKWLINTPTPTFNVKPETLEEDLFGYEMTNEIYDGVVTYEEYHISRIATAREILTCKMPIITSDVAEKIRDKTKMKKALQNHGVRIAPWAEWETIQGLRDAIRELKLQPGQYVLKPRLGSSSAGVYRAKKEDSLKETHQRFQKACQQSAIGAPEFQILMKPPYIIEQYMESMDDPLEIAVEGHVSNGNVEIMLISEKVGVKKHSPFTENIYVSPPFNLDIVIREEEISEITKRAVEAVGIENVVFHLELRIWRDKLLVLEIAGRPSGGLISESCVLRSGVDLRLQHACLAVGVDIPTPQFTETATCLGSIYADGNLNLQKIQEKP